MANCTTLSECAHFPPPSTPAPPPPNFFLMLTDDQDTMLGGGIDAMPFARDTLLPNGVNLTNFFAHTPVCCPSRSELLTGRYFHNIRDRANRSGGEVESPDDCMHVNATMNHGFEKLTFANPLRDAGHRTGMFGKYLNSGGMKHVCGDDHGEWHVPVGWSDFWGACPDTCYVNCTYNVNGAPRSFSDPAYPNGSNYGTSVIGNASLAFVSASLEAGDPFFAYVASHAPHGPATPAPWYRLEYPHAQAPRTEAWNVSSPDKHWVVATQPALTDSYVEKKIDGFFRDRLRSLLSVDDILRDAHQLVKSHGQLDSTYFIVTSDHGLHMGQYRLGACKRQPYDLDLRIPALVVGPSVARGSSLDAVAGIPDLAPTILELARLPAAATAQMDGRSLAPLLLTAGDDVGGRRWRDRFLIEYYATTVGADVAHLKDHLKDSGNNTFIGLRVLNASANLAYFEFTDVATDYGFERANFCELYDLSEDPHQLTNLCAKGGRERMRAALRDELYREYACKAEGCG